MEKLKKALTIRLEGAKRVAVLGVGSDLRADDAAGILAAKALEDRRAGGKGAVRLKVFLGATAPENLTGEIKNFKPTHLVIVDTAEMRERPGTMLVLKGDDLSGGVTFSTHIMPPKILVRYFQESIGCEVVIVGIQPKTIEFGRPVSKEVASAAKALARAIREAASAGAHPRTRRRRS